MLDIFLTFSNHIHGVGVPRKKLFGLHSVPRNKKVLPTLFQGKRGVCKKNTNFQTRIIEQPSNLYYSQLKNQSKYVNIFFPLSIHFHVIQIQLAQHEDFNERKNCIEPYLDLQNRFHQCSCLISGYIVKFGKTYKKDNRADNLLDSVLKTI